MKRRIISIALIAMLLVSLMTLFGGQDGTSPAPKKLAAADSSGASGGSGGWCWDIAEWNAMPQWLRDLRSGLGEYPCPPRADNPKIVIPDCVKPALTVALIVDRSSSVIADGASNTPQIFRQSINTLIEEFYSRFRENGRDGRINFLVYAFATKTVLQNKTTNGLTPVLASNLITDASSPAGRLDMLDTIQKIHFRDDESYPNKNLPNSDVNGFQHDGTIYGRQRAYNLSTESAPGEYGMTNWQDAFITVMDAAANPMYNNKPVGDSIDLAVMITDGLPTADDGTDWTWNPGTFHGSDTISYKPENDGVDRTDWTSVRDWNSKYDRALDDLYRITTDKGGEKSASQAIDFLRTGANPRDTINTARSIPTRRDENGNIKGISVKGIIVNTSSDPADVTNSQNYARKVFGDGNFFFATSFTSGPDPTTLESQIRSLVTNVFAEAIGCNLNIPLDPGIEISVTNPANASDPSEFVVEEGGPSAPVLITITNNGQGDLDEIVICKGTPADYDECKANSITGGVLMNGSAVRMVPSGESFDYTGYAFSMNYGDLNIEGDHVFTVYGKSTAVSVANGERYTLGDTTVHVTTILKRFPS